ncbi:MAG: N-acetylmuramoyl-L-alanine amidase [Bacteroidia bacterium]
MRLLVTLFIFGTSTLLAQTVANCKERFNKYLNLKGTLNTSVLFEKNAIHLLNEKGKKEFTIYENEIPVLSKYFENFPVEDQARFLVSKGTKRLEKKQLDSLSLHVDSVLSAKEELAKARKARYNKPLSGARIAIDPGHFSSNIIDSKVEGKFLNFVNQYTDSPDTIKIVEGQLTFLTAQLLRSMLEEQGAKVMLSRPSQNSTAFNVPYYYWYNKRKTTVLDSLREIKEITGEAYRTYMNQNKELFFWTFFRDYELVARANKINAFNPDVSVIIHYNVDEKNAPWGKASRKDLTMCFIGGAFIKSDLKKPNNKLHFLRLLLSDQVEKSESLSHYTVSEMSQNLKISKARPTDADYLVEKGIKSSQEGVFCRNLILTRYINSPLVYGESLYQDNLNECSWLNSCNYVAYGYKIPERIHQVAKSYFDAIMKYYSDSQAKISGN